MQSGTSKINILSGHFTKGRPPWTFSNTFQMHRHFPEAALIQTWRVGCLRILSNLSPHHFLDFPHDCLPSGNDAVAVFLHEGVHLFFRIGVVF